MADPLGWLYTTCNLPDVVGIVEYPDCFQGFVQAI